jgi:hypothetical protein
MRILAWGVLWRSKNRLDGVQRHLMYDYIGCNLLVFRTRRRARMWIEEHHGYIRTRPDLRAEPHGWMMPIPVRVTVEATGYSYAKVKP